MKLFTEQENNSVTGSRHFLETKDGIIGIDCGAYQGEDKKEEVDKKNSNLKNISKLKWQILTHAHYDHCGLLPLLVKNGYLGKIYSTSATRDLANLIMLDSAKIQQYDLEQGKRENIVYSEKDCVKAMNSFNTISYEKKESLSKHLEFEFFDAGHIMGSSLTELFVKEGFFNKEKRILFTGDLGRYINKPLIEIPQGENIIAPHYIVLESTYGNRIHSSIETTKMDLAKIINETIAKGGKVLIPSFAAQRTQDLIAELHKLQDLKWIPNVKIYVDSPLAESITNVFSIHPECYNTKSYNDYICNHGNPLNFKELCFVKSPKEGDRIDAKKDPCIIIAASGMLESGRSPNHLYNLISDEKNTVLTCGYMASGTLGRKLLDGDKTITVLGKKKKVKARIESIDGMSSHADKNEILQFLDSIDTSKLKKIFLVHGDVESRKSLKQLLESKGYKVEIMEQGKEYKL